MSTTVPTDRRWSWGPLTVRLMLAQTAVLVIGLIIVVRDRGAGRAEHVLPRARRGRARR